MAEYLRKYDPDSNADKSIISRYEKKGVEPKTFKTVETLANLFGVKVSYLTGSSEHRYGEKQSPKPVPILRKNATGRPIPLQEDIIGYEYVAPQLKLDFCLIVEGDSMIKARLCGGDLVFVRRQDSVENGAIAVVTINDGDAVLKRLYTIDGTTLLFADYPRYDCIVISRKDRKSLKIMGKVISIKGKVR